MHWYFLQEMHFLVTVHEMPCIVIPRLLILLLLLITVHEMPCIVIPSFLILLLLLILCTDSVYFLSHSISLLRSIFLSSFQYFPSSLSLYCLYPEPLLFTLLSFFHSYFLLPLFFPFFFPSSTLLSFFHSSFLLLLFFHSSFLLSLFF